MSSSESEVQTKVKTSKKDKNSKKAAVVAEKSTPAVEYQIKPAKGGPSMDTSTWPLLLKVCSQTINI